VKVRYRRKALAQIELIFSYIEEQDADAALRVKHAIKTSIDRLGLFPYSARPSAIIGIRELPIRRFPYIVFYTVDDAAQEVQILRVRHTSQDPKKHLK
jgi:toxin ParE1/3/4